MYATFDCASHGHNTNETYCFYIVVRSVIFLALPQLEVLLVSNFSPLFCETCMPCHLR